MKRMKNLTVKTEIKRKKTMDKNLIGAIIPFVNK